LQMLDEALTCIRSLWTQERTTFAGEFYRFRDAVLAPKPVQTPHPPILLGGGGKGLLRVAAKHADVVNIISDAGKPGYIKMANVPRLPDDRFRARGVSLPDEARHHGRAPGAIRISKAVFPAIVPDPPAATLSMAEGMAPVFQTTPEGLLHSP